jgi:hypothetical protein
MRTTKMKKVEVLLFAEYGKARSNIDDLKESIKKNN